MLLMALPSPTVAQDTATDEPLTAEGCVERGIGLNSLGLLGASIRMFDQAVELDPNYVPAYFNRGNTYLALENYEQAIVDFSKAIELNSDHFGAYYNRGLTYAAEGLYTQAIADFSRAIARDPRAIASQKVKGDNEAKKRAPHVQEPTQQFERLLWRLARSACGRTLRPSMLDIIIIAICGVLCGADSWVGVETVGKAKENWFREFLDLEHGIPSRDTFGYVLAKLDHEAFQSRFVRWVESVFRVTKGQVIAIDGKTSRGSHDQAIGQDAIHLVSAWASANGIALGQRKVDDKSNEITAIPELLTLLDVSGCIVTIDAMGCQTQIAQTIRDEKAD
jgi:hypothetical protein